MVLGCSSPARVRRTPSSYRRISSASVPAVSRGLVGPMMVAECGTPAGSAAAAIFDPPNRAGASRALANSAGHGMDRGMGVYIARRPATCQNGLPTLTVKKTLQSRQLEEGPEMTRLFLILTLCGL